MKTTPKAPEIQKPSAFAVIKSIALRACFYYTVISLVLLVFHAVAGTRGTYVEPSRFLMILPFALTVALADCVFRSTLRRAVKVLIHYASLTLGFYLFLFLPVKSSANPIVLIALLTVIYAAAAVPVLIIIARREKKQIESVPYQSVYAKVTKK